MTLNFTYWGSQSHENFYRWSGLKQGEALLLFFSWWAYFFLRFSDGSRSQILTFVRYQHVNVPAFCTRKMRIIGNIKLLAKYMASCTAGRNDNTLPGACFFLIGLGRILFSPLSPSRRWLIKSSGETANAPQTKNVITVENQSWLCYLWSINLTREGFLETQKVSVATLVLS